MSVIGLLSTLGGGMPMIYHSNIVNFNCNVDANDSALAAQAVAIGYGIDNSGAKSNYTVNGVTLNTSLNVYNFITSRIVFISTGYDPNICQINNSTIAWYNTTGYNGGVTGYPAIQLIAPLGSNLHQQLTFSPDTESNVITCGSSVADPTLNGTAYGNALSLFNTYNTTSSEATGYIIGQLLYIQEQRSKRLGYWEPYWNSRYAAYQTADDNTSYPLHDLNNGWGKLNVLAAIAFSGTIPTDPFL